LCSAGRDEDFLSHFTIERRCYRVDATSEALSETETGKVPFDLESIFRVKYAHIARVIARIVRDRARAEELAVEVFLKLWRTRQAQGDKADGWLYRTAIRTALDELRRTTRRARYERLLGFARSGPSPEEMHAAMEEQEKVRMVLKAIAPRQAELLLLRSEDLSYAEIADALELNPASVGTLLSRAQNAFRKEYVSRHGNE
jgi:RNA polymerase sigma-70 factor, ECF subfamily